MATEGYEYVQHGQKQNGQISETSSLLISRTKGSHDNVPQIYPTNNYVKRRRASVLELGGDTIAGSGLNRPSTLF